MNKCIKVLAPYLLKKNKKSADIILNVLVK